MKKRKILMALLLSSGVYEANAVGWPAGYEGVMLQSFHWEEDATPAESLDIRWSDMTNRVEEFAGSFDLIWVPNSGKGGSTLGYLPIYWFTNHNTKMGTEEEFLNMVKVYKEHGAGFIADVIVNHRQGATGWYDFPAEEWDGRTWQLGLNDIVSDDELANEAGQPKPTGNADEGAWPGVATLPCTYCRDLDHKSANVQENVRNYMRCLYEKYGYVGRRYDYMRGFDARRITDFNHYMRATHPEQPTFSVGEFWDSNYDQVKKWIDATGKESAAFDFPFKYALKAAFDGDDDMTKLVWYANGETPQPAGMIHYGYAQYAVTFIDNHDSYRDEFNEGNNFKDTKHIPAANAFMLCSPGTPCVFIHHWNAYKSEIAKMIEARKAAGVSNTSKVTVLQTTKDCYMAEVVGSKGRLVVKIGSAMVSPDASLGYGDPYCSGTDYCIWVKNSGGESAGGESGNMNVPSDLYVLGTIKGASWDTSAGKAFTKSGHQFTVSDVELVAAENSDKAYFTFVTTLGHNWDAVNGSDRFGAPNQDEAATTEQTAYVKQYFANWNASEAKSWVVTPGIYTISVDFDNMNMTLSKQGDIEPEPEPDPKPNTLTVYWDNTNCNWAAPKVYSFVQQSKVRSLAEESPTEWPGISMTKVDEKGNMYRATLPANSTGCVFNDGVGEHPAQTADFTVVDGHIYNSDGDMSLVTPDNLYMVGTFNDTSWDLENPLKGTKTDKVFVWEDVAIDDAGEGSGYFTFITQPGKTWDGVNSGNRYGATSKDFALTPTESAITQKYIVNKNASSAESWKIAADTYNIVVDLNVNTVTVYKPVKEELIKFRDDEDTGWLVNGFVPSSSENYDNVYLTIWYAGVDGNTTDAAWDNKHTGTLRYSMNGTQNRTTTEPDDDAAPITAEQLAAAPVHLNVSVELDNGEGDNTWKVVDTDKYPDWSWNETDHESVPADFYRNQVQDYPTAQGYIRIPLMAKNNKVTVTARPNADYNLYGGEPATVTRTYSYAKGSTTSVDLQPTDNVEQSTPIYYNLQGIQVNNPGRGVYIKVEGGRVSKTTIK